MFRALKLVLEQIVKRGDLRLISATGTTHRFGDGTGERVVLRITRRSVEPLLGLDPSLSVAEAYMDGRLVVEQGRIYDFLEIVLSNA